jgi:hypothetical protein
MPEICNMKAGFPLAPKISIATYLILIIRQTDRCMNIPKLLYKI